MLPPRPPKRVKRRKKLNKRCMTLGPPPACPCASHTQKARLPRAKVEMIWHTQISKRLFLSIGFLDSLGDIHSIFFVEISSTTRQLIHLDLLLMQLSLRAMNTPRPGNGPHGKRFWGHRHFAAGQERRKCSLLVDPLC